MAVTKAASTLFTAQTTTATSSAVDVSGADEADIYASIAISGAVASVAPSIQPQWSPDGGTTWYNGRTYTTDTAIGTYYFPLMVPDTAKSVRLLFTAGTTGGGGTHTCNAQAGTLTR